MSRQVIKQKYYPGRDYYVPGTGTEQGHGVYFQHNSKGRFTGVFIVTSIKGTPC